MKTIVNHASERIQRGRHGFCLSYPPHGQSSCNGVTVPLKPKYPSFQLEAQPTTAQHGKEDREGHSHHSIPHHELWILVSIILVLVIFDIPSLSSSSSSSSSSLHPWTPGSPKTYSLLLSIGKALPGSHFLLLFLGLPACNPRVSFSIVFICFESK